MRERILKKLASWHVDHPLRMGLIVLTLTIIFAFLASGLKQTMRWSDLLPTNDQRTIQFNRVIKEFVTATNIVIVIQGEEEKIKAFADDLAPKLLNAVDEKLDRKILQRIDYKTELDFLKQHGLMLIKKDDLANLQDVFLDPNLPALITNINDSLEKEYVGRSESITTREKEDQAVGFLNGIQDLLVLLKHISNDEYVDKKEILAASDSLLYGEPYFLSYDHKTLLMVAVPNFSMMDLDLVVSGTEIVQNILDKQLSNHPGIYAGLTGMIPVGHDEMVYSQKSLGYTTLIAIIAILIMLIISFRMWSAPLLAMINLIIGVIWAIGTATIVVGQLNIMTSMMAVILLGLGIDFSIHLMTGFTERRAAGDSLLLSMETTFLKSGKGILTGGITTAFAFLALTISHSRGMKEMGLVTGLGLIAILLSTFLCLPLLLLLREKRKDRKNKKFEITPQGRDISFRFLGKTCLWLSHHYIFTLAAAIVITGLLIWSGSKITFDHNYMNIEPKGIPSVTLQDTIQKEFDMSMEYALVIADDLDQSRGFAKSFKKLPTVAAVEDISLYLPSPQEQDSRRSFLQTIRTTMEKAKISKALAPSDIIILTEQLDRLRMNIMEIQDMAFLGGQDKVDNKCREIVGDPDSENTVNLITKLQWIKNDNFAVSERLSALNSVFSPYFQSSVLKMASTEPITLASLPESILDKYANEDRTGFLITVIPSENGWQNAEFLKQFVSDLEQVSDKATGMPPVFQALIEVIGSDGKNAALLTLAVVFLLLWIDFRKPYLALIAMIPLGIGIFWMVGFMKIFGMPFTVMNVMALPLIIGIGIDDGVHIVHRWLSEGKGKLYTVYSGTGKAILLTTLTTMLAFGSLVFSIWPGFGQLGGALFLGSAACFLTTVILLAGIMGAIERARKNSL